MGTIFSETLVTLRKETGFRTAYRFFYDNGGQELLGVSYRNYLLIEGGKHLPAFGNIHKYLYALRITPRSSTAMRLTTAWLKTMLGEEEFLRELGPFLKLPEKESITSPMHKVIRKSLAQKKIFIRPAQVGVLAHSKTHYLCWTALCNDTANWTPSRLAAELKLPEAPVRKALEDLRTAGLLKTAGGGAFKCPAAGTMLEYPYDNALAAVPGLKNKFLAMREWLVSSGKMCFRRRGVVRASLTELANCFPLLSLNTSTADAYAVTEKCADSALFCVECSVSKLRDF